MKISINEKYWNWKIQYEGDLYGRWHNYYGQTMDQLEKTAEREWTHDLALLNKFKEMDKKV